MAADVSIFAALFAGLISFLSPCVLPLVPPYLAYLAGASVERLAEAEPESQVKRDTVVAALLFVAGFSTVFIALGASASTIGQVLVFFRAWFAGKIRQMEATAGLEFPLSLDPFALLAGVVIILMGLHFLNVFRIKFLMREKRFEVGQPVGLWGAYVMGLAFAFGWTPCIGPILAAILAVAASEATVTKGAGLLAVYSLGLGVPFVIAALAVEPFARFLTRFKAYLPYVERAMGVLLILTGLAFVFDLFTQLNAWLIETFPVLQTIG
jgi:cytochrome c-type biogenesis protein